jgi:hypothetical protein
MDDSMIVDKIWKLTNVVRVGLAPRSSHSQRQATFSWNFFFKPQATWARAMGKRAGNTNTAEGVKGKKVNTTSDDAGGKSASEKSKSTGGKCVSENSTGGNPGATRTSNNPFEASRSEKCNTSLI